jgi:NADPH:quinone reductase-like Zn-dependent oxidoreductase
MCFKIPDEIDWELAASLPVTTLTPYHALEQAALKINEFLLIFGASGSTGMMATQFAKKMGAKVIAVSRQNWVKEFGERNSWIKILFPDRNFIST